jgi:hypothetical protein
MRRTLLIGLVLIVLFGGLSPARAQQPPRIVPDLIAALNAWRVEHGIWPLKPNPVLDELALAQAEYLLTLPDLPDGGEIHDDASGGGPKDRARQTPYNWPTYGRPEQIALDEIAYVGHNVDAALAFWKSSSIHSASSLNPAYREVGVAAVPHTFGYLFIVVLGGRPNVLPALADSAGDTVYLSNDMFRLPGNDSAWIYQATQVRFFDAEGRPLGAGWLDWKPSLPLPNTSGDRVFVAYTDGKQTTLSEVNLAAGQVLLPGTATAVAAVPTPTPAFAQPTLPPATAPAVVVPGQTVTPVAAVPTPTATLTATQPVPGALLVVYDRRSLALVNASSSMLDVSQIVLAQGDETLPAAAWNTPWLASPLNALPMRDCLHVWSWDEPSDVSPPSDCRYQRGVINIAPEERFWIDGEFEVREGDSLLATCPGGTGRCTVSVP